MIQDLVHKQIVNKMSEVEDWFAQKQKGMDFPIYASFDMRDAGFKITNVDANIYPAGFNNICDVDKESASERFEEYLTKRYGSGAKRILLLTEEHTQNAYYWENVSALKKLIEDTGRKVLLGIPRKLEESLVVTSASGIEMSVVAAFEGAPCFEQFKPDLVISNNDFSFAHEEWGSQLHIPVNPPRQLGWYQRKKDQYFHFFNQYAEEFAKLIGVDPWLFTVETKAFQNFDIGSEESRERLAQSVDEMISDLKKVYESRGIAEDPFVFVKNNSGTYGLAVLKAASGEEVLSWNYKDRKKMKAAKGGGGVNEVIVQEGIPSIVREGDLTAEPVIYLVGSELAGGFLRAHNKKGPNESLNSPGAVYKRLCVSDLKVDVEGAPLENVYGWIAKLGMLAIAAEGKELNIPEF